MSSQELPQDGCFWLLDSRQLERIALGWQYRAGSGSFGVVYKGRLPDEYGGVYVAVKWLKKQNLDGVLSADAQREIDISRIIRSRSDVPGYDNLVCLLGYCRQPQALLYEWLGGGTLESLLKDGERLSELTLRDRLMLFKGMASGLGVMHHGGDEEIRHKDIKPDNAMLDEDLRTAKLADYGVAKVQNTATSPTTDMFVGNRLYQCPMVGHTLVRTTASDVYSMGVILLQLILGEADAVIAKQTALDVREGRTSHVAADPHMPGD